MSVGPPSPFHGILHAADSTTCVAAFKAALAQFGIDTFASGEVDLSNRDRSIFHVIDWPQAWRDYYFGSDLLEHDPVVENLAYFAGPFTWQDMRAERRLAQVGSESLTRMAEAGWRDGLVVPIARGGTRYGLVSIVSRRLIGERERAAMVPICVCFHSVIGQLVRRNGFAQPPAGLTPREIECLRLVARGRSDRQIAAELGISPATAHEHVERAKRRLAAGNRAELAAIAVSLGIIDAG
jgi:LuxR family transcriptional regulator, quorum-sensing system regulator BjaR1